jgi:hypothetical protein
MILTRTGGKTRTLVTIISVLFSVVGSKAVAACPRQEIKQENSSAAASLGCPRQQTNQQETNQRHPSAVPVSFEEVIVPIAPNDQMILLELQNDPGPMFWIENLIKSQHKEIASPLDIQLYGASHADPIRILEEKSVKGRLDLQTGDILLYPTLGKLDSPITLGNISSLSETARRILTSSDFLAHDETTITVDKPAVLMGAMIVRGGDGTTHYDRPPTAYLGYFLARRQVGEYSVYGTGSKASIVLNGMGEVVGLSRVWKRAVRTQNPVHASRSPQEVVNAIRSQLLSYPGDTNKIDVNSIQLAYYDENRRYLQPVYRFTATVHHHLSGNRGSLVRDDSVIGYLPYAHEAIEPLTELSGEGKGSPLYAPKEVSPPGREEANVRFVGRYVTRDWQPSSWVGDANDFFTQLSSSGGHSFKDAQYYWADPRLFTKDKKSFISAMDVALVEGDGDWWMFGTTTNDCSSSPQSWCDLQKCCKSPQNCCSTSNCCSLQTPDAKCCRNLFDPVNINGDIPSPGYGEHAGGKLTTWIIHSCEVIPAPEDTPYWATPWWAVFGGLRSVVGYRTPMVKADKAGAEYGRRLGRGDPIVGAWLQEVISLKEYSGHPCTVSHGGISRPWGLPSAISACGHQDDSLFSTSAVEQSNCLSVWWFSDKNPAGQLCQQN